ncbi:MAG TPA: Smr/MutS family protein [Magnetospirillaceae bacterium]|jgi:DNA-nicking Smr family endonuclease
MARTRTLQPDEAQLFQETLRDAKPLHGKKRKAAAPAAPTKASKAKASSAEAHPARKQPTLPPRTAPLAPLAPGPTPGVDRRTHDRFKKGEMVIDAKLDLHGMTQDAAHDALLRFVERGANAGYRCILVVTGKGLREGSGVLRTMVPRWLNEASLRPYLLAINRARPQHGGDGALYVLLKRKR